MDNKNNKSKSINMKLTNKKKLQKKITKVKTSNNLIRSQTNIKKQKIHAEIIKIINQNMEKLQNKLILSKQYDFFDIDNALSVDFDILNKYKGEKIPLISLNDSNNEKKIKGKKTINRHSTKSNLKFNDEKKTKIKKKKGKNENHKNKSIIKHTSSVNIARFNTYDTNTDTETIFNYSNFGKIDDNSKNNRIENTTSNIFIYNSNQKTSKKSSISSYDYKIKLITKDNHNRNLSLYDSTSTSVTFNKFKFHQPSDDAYSINNYLKYNKTELANFFIEINLPSIYADKFLDNGFDDLNILLTLTKTSISITNQNLKEIGIKNGGHRAQILIHLEERAEIIPYILEKDIIYNNNQKDICSDDSLLKFLSKIKCDNYIDNFKRNGYTNSELLFSQMLTRQPITREMLIEDFHIDNKDVINLIINGLKNETNNYIKKITNHNTNVTYIHKKYNSCENCLLF